MTMEGNIIKSFKYFFYLKLALYVGLTIAAPSNLFAWYFVLEIDNLKAELASLINNCHFLKHWYTFISPKCIPGIGGRR